MVHSVLDQETGQILKYHQLIKHPRFKEVWNRFAADKFGRLAQGIDGWIKGTYTIRFIHKHQIPQDRLKDVTYIKFVCTIRTEKKDPYTYQSNDGRQPHQLPWRCRYPNSQPFAHQDIPEQRHFDERCKICKCRHLQLLPHDTSQTARIRKG